jgi:short-subunit dehydrogenase
MKALPTVVITGAAQGIGRGVALALSQRGCAVVTDGARLSQAISEIESQVGPTGVLVACAGIGGLTQVPDLDVAGLRAMLEVNVVGVARAIDAVLPGMIARGGGHIVGVSSVAGFRGMPWMASYSASKAALSAYLEALRPALKRRGITITTACPGFVRTALTRDTPFRHPVSMLEPEAAGRYIARAALRRPRNCVFPLSTALGMSFLRHMPDAIFDWMMDRAGPRALTTEF